MLLSYLSFFTFLSCVILGILALYLDSKARLNRAFFLISLSSAVWAFGYIFIYIESDKAMIWFWYRFAVIGGIYLFFATYNFLYVFADLEGGMRHIFSAFRPVYFLFLSYLAYIHLTGTIFVVNFVKTPWGNAGIVDTALPGYFLLNIAAAVSFISGILVLMAGRKYHTSKRYRILMRGLIPFTGVPVLFIVLSNFLLPVVSAKPVPFMGVIYLNITVAGIFYLITTYRLMRINYSLLEPGDIVSHISDMILLLDGNFRIVMANEAAAEILTVPQDMLKDRPLPEITDDHENTATLLRDLVKGRDDSLSLRITYRQNDGEMIMTETYISKIKDKLSDIIGIMVISREIRGRKEFRRAYSISDREIEVLDLILAGKSARSVAEKLCISPRTVETHTINIYNKLGVNSKPELFSFCARFSLLS